MTKELKEMTDLHKKVFMLLPIGIHSSISTQEIEVILGIEERYVREIISILIMEYGIPIGSFRYKNNGYFIATSEEEKRIGTHSLAEQVNSMEARLKKVEEADLGTALVYKNKYRFDAVKKEKQSNIYEYINQTNPDSTLSDEEMEDIAVWV